MKITHKGIQVANKIFTVPEELGGKVTFNADGIVDVSAACGEYLIAAGFEAVEKIPEPETATETATEPEPEVATETATEIKPEKKKKGK